MKTLVALALAAMGLGSSVEPSAISEVEIDGALGEDDVCAAATGEEGARCALQALQLKAGKLETEAEEEGEEQNACTSGLVGQIRSFAPGCINACPQALGVRSRSGVFEALCDVRGLQEGMVKRGFVNGGPS